LIKGECPLIMVAIKTTTRGFTFVFVFFNKWSWGSMQNLQVSMWRFWL
jgi:hypothetical protein